MKNILGLPSFHFTTEHLSVLVYNMKWHVARKVLIAVHIVKSFKAVTTECTISRMWV